MFIGVQWGTDFPGRGWGELVWHQIKSCPIFVYLLPLCAFDLVVSHVHQNYFLQTESMVIITNNTHAFFKFFSGGRGAKKP